LLFFNISFDFGFIPTSFLLIYFSDYLFELHHIILSIVFLAIILHAVNFTQTVINLERSVLNYFGIISYGIYMFHTIMITLSYRILAAIMGTEYSMGLNILLYVLSFTLTIIFASLSYKYFESIFLRKKTKYAKVISGDEARLTV